MRKTKDICEAVERKLRDDPLIDEVARVPDDVNLKMLRLHVPEALGLRTEYGE